MKALDAGVTAVKFGQAPGLPLYVITCIDPRVDPAFIFDLALGDVIVARSLGGRVSPEMIADLAWISYLHEVKAPDAAWFDIAVVHHTDCGRGLDDDALVNGFAERGFDGAALVASGVFDPTHSVPEDVEKLLNAPHLSPKIMISGYAYDVKTGLLETVVPPRSRDDQ